MERITERLRTRTAAVLFAVAGGALLVGCGDDDDFANDPRPPVPLQLTGVITDERVTISPRTVAPGPVVIIIDNQTDRSHLLRLVGPGVRERVGPVNPSDTGTLQATLEDSASARYEVMANSEGGAVNPDDVIDPAVIRIDEKPREECERLESEGRSDPQCRGSSSDELLLP